MKALAAISLVLGCLAAPLSAHADFPSRDMTVIVPNNPGGGTDISTRGLVEFAKPYINRNVAVVNKPGVAGFIDGARARPDGHTLVMNTVELAIFPHLKRSPVSHEDFRFLVAPIAEPAALIVPGDSPFNSVEEFIEHAKQNPKSLKIGNAGIASIWHLASVALQQNYDITVVDVPYEGGSAGILAALMGGHLDGATFGPATANAQIKSGELKLLAVMGDERLPMFPDAPTFKELGYDFVVRAWAALAMPAKTDDATFEALSGIFTKALNDPEYKTYMEKQGIVLNTASVEQVNQMVADDHAYYGELLETLDMK